MRNLADFRLNVSRPGTAILATSMTIAGTPVGLRPEQAAPRRVVEVCEDAIFFDDGRMMPLGCAARLIFNGAPDRFIARIGPAIVQYDIIQGAC